jgi:hypothetical protein
LNNGSASTFGFKYTSATVIFPSTLEGKGGVESITGERV